MNNDPLPVARKKRYPISWIFIGDCLVVAFCMFVAYYLRYMLNLGVVEGEDRPPVLAYLLHYSAGFSLFFLLAWNLDLYDSNVAQSLERSLSRLIKISLYWAVMFLGLSLILKLSPPVSRLFVGYTCGLMCILLPLWRISRVKLVYEVCGARRFVRKVLVVGCPDRNQAFVDKLAMSRNEPCDVVGVVADGKKVGAKWFSLTVLGGLDSLESVLEHHSVDDVVVADSEIGAKATLRIAKICERNFVEFNLVPNQFDVFTQCLGLKMLGRQPVLGVSELPQNNMFSSLLKRMLDIIGAIVGLALTVSIFPIVYFLIRRESPGPVIYRQIRTGVGGKPFTIFKFRSMKLSSEADGKARWCSENDGRRLKIGAFLRKWNIDELPQFWNVLKGDMSLVGPRPERPELIRGFLDEIPHYQSRHSVRPGMTGWAQVNGLRGNTSLEDRIKHDLQYIENWSIWLDIVIQVRTLFQYKNAY